MSKGRGVAITVFLVTAILIAFSLVHPNQSAEALADAGTSGLLRPSSTPQAAVENLAREIGQRHWASAYSKLANKGEFDRSGLRARSERNVHESAQLRHVWTISMCGRCMQPQTMPRCSSS